MPGSVSIHAFDGSRKGEWLLADINGFTYTWIAVNLGGGVIVTVLAALIGAMTGWDAVSYVWNLVNRSIEVSTWATLGVASILPFLVVFVLRRNFTVVGPRRTFRYFCRWI